MCSQKHKCTCTCTHAHTHTAWWGNQAWKKCEDGSDHAFLFNPVSSFHKTLPLCLCVSLCTCVSVHHKTESAHVWLSFDNSLPNWLHQRANTLSSRHRKVIKDSDFHGFAPQVGNQLRQKIQRWNIQKRKNFETLLLNKTALTVYPKNGHDWWMETQREERNEGAVTPGDQQAFGLKVYALLPFCRWWRQGSYCCIFLRLYKKTHTRKGQTVEWSLSSSARLLFGDAWARAATVDSAEQYFRRE